jgi:hypothetical protein
MKGKIGTRQKAALLKAFAAAAALIPTETRRELALIGGTSFLKVEATETRTILTSQSQRRPLHEFWAVAEQNDRFCKGPVDNWEYTASNSIIVKLQFLAQGQGFAPSINKVEEVGSGGAVCASLQELALMKAKADDNRGSEEDLRDYDILLKRMAESGERFEYMPKGTEGEA